MIGQVLLTEFLKLRRSRVPGFTLAALSMGPLGIALFMWIVREPGRAASLGLLGTKANLAGMEATWPAYGEYVAVIAGVGGMLLLSFVVAYVFGREYEEGTAKNLLASPVERHWFVLAKLTVAAAWWAALVAIVLAEALAIGLALGLPGFSVQGALTAAAHAAVAAAVSYLVVPVIAWITVWSRGYMAPIGFAIVTMGLGNLFGKTGWSVWFPWSIVPSLVGMVGNQAESLPAASYVVVAVTFAGGIAGTIAQLRYADNAQ